MASMVSGVEANRSNDLGPDADLKLYAHNARSPDQPLFTTSFYNEEPMALGSTFRYGVRDGSASTSCHLPRVLVV
jgi:hypothetical protein